MILKLKSTVKEHYHYHSTANNNLLHSPGLSQLRSQDGEEKLHLSCVQIWQPFCPAQPSPGLCLGRYAYPCHRKLFHPVPQAPHRSYGPQTLAVGCCGASREGAGATHIPLAGPVMCLHCGRTQERMLEAWHIYQNQPRFSHYQFPLDNWSGLAEGKESVPWLLHSVTLSLEAVNERHLLANGKSPGMTDGDGGQHPLQIGKPCALSLHIKMEALCP